MSKDIEENCRKYVAVKDHLSSNLGGETVILSVKTGKYYGVNDVSHSIWEAVAEPSTLDEIVDHLMSLFEVDRVTCTSNVKKFLGVLKEEGLVQLTE